MLVRFAASVFACLVALLAVQVATIPAKADDRTVADFYRGKTIKMVIPLVLFILPSLLVVTLGPAMIQLFRTLLPGDGR